MARARPRGRRPAERCPAVRPARLVRPAWHRWSWRSAPEWVSRPPCWRRPRPTSTTSPSRCSSPASRSCSCASTDAGLTNVALLRGDAVALLRRRVPPASLAGIRIFFPDPWPKRRHHKRRLVQPDFVALAASRLAPGGTLHLATDWDDYAVQMRAVCDAEPLLPQHGGGRTGRLDTAPVVASRHEVRAARPHRRPCRARSRVPPHPVRDGRRRSADAGSRLTRWQIAAPAAPFDSRPTPAPCEPELRPAQRLYRPAQWAHHPLECLVIRSR